MGIWWSSFLILIFPSFERENYLLRAAEEEEDYILRRMNLRLCTLRRKARVMRRNVIKNLSSIFFLCCSRWLGLFKMFIFLIMVFEWRNRCNKFCFLWPSCIFFSVFQSRNTDSFMVTAGGRMVLRFTLWMGASSRFGRETLLY